MSVDSTMTVPDPVTKTRTRLSVALIALFFVLASRYFALPTVNIGGGVDVSLEIFLFFSLLTASLFAFMMMRKGLEKEFLFVLLFPSVGLLYLGYGLFIAHNDTHRAFFEYQPIMFYLSAIFPLVFLRDEADAEFVLKAVVYSTIVFLPVLLLQYLSLKTFGYVFLPGSEVDSGKVWLNDAGRFVPAAQDVALLVSIYAYWKVLRGFSLRNILLVVLFAVALLLTYSRGLWLSYAIGIAFVSWHEKRLFLKRFYTLPMLVVICMAMIFFLYMSGLSDSMLNRFGMMSTSTVSTDMSLKWRVYETEEAVKAIVASPVVGHGLGYEYHKRGVFVSDSFFLHNAYLFLLVKTGLLGFLAMTAFILLFIKTAMAVYKDYSKNYIVSGVAIASAAYMTAMVFGSITRPYLVTFTSTITLVSLVFGVFLFLRIHKRKAALAAKTALTRRGNT